MDEDEVLGKITRLLEKGCTMLATHHDCGAPLFRCEGNIVCPVCSFEDESLLPERGQSAGLSRDKEDEKPGMNRAHLPQRDGRSSSPCLELEQPGPGSQDDVDLLMAKGNLHAVLLLRMKELTASLQGEQDLDKLKKQMDCLEGLLRVLRSLKD
jgi:UPF0148 protein